LSAPTQPTDAVLTSLTIVSGADARDTPLNSTHEATTR